MTREQQTKAREVMRELSNWYEFEFKDRPPKQFGPFARAMRFLASLAGEDAATLSEYLHQFVYGHGAIADAKIEKIVQEVLALKASP